MNNDFTFDHIPEKLAEDLPKNFPDMINKYLELLFRWNKRINLISRKEARKDIINRHILDSLQLISLIKEEEIVTDLGSGAGFPGLILSFAGIKNVNLIEMNKKKASFLVQASLISNNKVKVFGQKIENIDNIGNLNTDIITARAFSDISDIIRITKKMRNKNTKYILLKGKNYIKELNDLKERYNCSTWNIQSISDIDGMIINILDVSEKNSEFMNE